MEKSANKKQKWLLMIPVFLLPVIAFSIWSLFINGSSDSKENSKSGNAFNDKLPSANLKEAGKNKLEIYMQAQADSLKIKEQQEQDPYSKRLFDPTPPNDVPIASEYQPKNELFPNRQNTTVDQSEQKVKDRIDKLYEALNENNISKKLPSLSENDLATNDDGDIKKLEEALSSLNHSDTSNNPEMKQLESLLDKILDIQHLDRLKGRLTTQEEKKVADSSKFSVNTKPVSNDLYTAKDAIKFWGLDDVSQPTISDTTTIIAAIHKTQKLQDGQILKMRLLQDVFINGIQIPQGNFVFGKCQIEDARVMVSIQNIAFSNFIFPVQLTVYDHADGMEGINIQGDGTQEIPKNGMDQFLQQLQLNSMSSSLGVQAASSGMQTAKNLLSKKIKKATVTLKAGHLLLLKKF